MKFIGYVTVIIGLMFFSAMFSGYALSVLWGWFISPYFNAPELSIPLAIGVALIVQYLTHQQEKAESGRDISDVLMEGAARAITKPAVAIGMGWFVTLWL